MDDDERTESEHEHEGNVRGTALKAAAAAAATGAAAFAVKKAMSGSNGSSHSANGTQRERGSGGASNSLISSIASGGWDAARDALVPLAEDAAAAAGKYLAESSPDVVRERIVPRFIASFNDTRGE